MKLLQLLFFISWFSRCTIAAISLIFISRDRLVQEDPFTHTYLVVTFSFVLLVNSLGLPETIHFLRTKRSLYLETLPETIPFLKRQFLSITFARLISELFHLTQNILLIGVPLLIWDAKDQQVAQPIAICCCVFFGAYFFSLWWIALRSHNEPDYASELESNETATESDEGPEGLEPSG